MNTDKNQKEFYDKLRKQLYDTSLWPSEYLYKFIVLTDSTGVKDVEDLFNNIGAVINTKESKNGKYTSLSINVKMKNPDAVIEKYIEVTEKVEGIISL